MVVVGRGSFVRKSPTPVGHLQEGGWLRSKSICRPDRSMCTAELRHRNNCLSLLPVSTQLAFSMKTQGASCYASNSCIAKPAAAPMPPSMNGLPLIRIRSGPEAATQGTNSAQRQQQQLPITCKCCIRGILEALRRSSVFISEGSTDRLWTSTLCPRPTVGPHQQISETLLGVFQKSSVQVESASVENCKSHERERTHLKPEGYGGFRNVRLACDRLRSRASSIL